MAVPRRFLLCSLMLALPGCQGRGLPTSPSEPADVLIPATATIGVLGTSPTSPHGPADGVIPGGYVTVTPAAATLGVGQSHQFTAVVRNPTGKVLPDRAIAWSSSNPAIATVNASGLTTAHATGTVTLSARSGAIRGTATLLVSDSSGWSLEIDQEDVTIAAIGTTSSPAWTPLQLTATLLDEAGQLLSLPITWASADPGIATVDNQGVARGVTPGMTSITATVGALTATVGVCVGGGIAQIDLQPGSGPQLPPTLYLEATAIASCGQSNADVRYSWSCQGTNSASCNSFLAAVADGSVRSYEFPLSAGEIFNIGVRACLHICSAPVVHSYDGADGGSGPGSAPAAHTRDESRARPDRTDAPTF